MLWRNLDAATPMPFAESDARMAIVRSIAGTIASAVRAPLAPLFLRHGPGSHAWLLLIQNAVVRDRDRGLGDGIDVDRGVDGSAPGR